MTETNDPKTELFLDGLVKIVSDLKEGMSQDPEMVLLIGSLTDRLCNDAGAGSWSELKSNLGEDETQKLIDTFAREIEESGEKGEIRIAYAMQAVAVSLVGPRFTDPRIGPGIDLLDGFIAAARDFFVRNQSQTN